MHQVRPDQSHNCKQEVKLLPFRCLLEKDPIAQKHVARIQKLRGTYDSLGNMGQFQSNRDGKPLLRVV